MCAIQFYCNTILYIVLHIILIYCTFNVTLLSLIMYNSVGSLRGYIYESILQAKGQLK